MSMDLQEHWKLLALILGLAAIGGYLLFAQEYGGSPSGSVSISGVPSTVQAGGSFSGSYTLSGYSYSSPGWFCLSEGSTQSSSWCNSDNGKCLTPCTWKGALDDMTSYGYGYQVLYCYSTGSRNGGSCDLSDYDLGTISYACDTMMLYGLGNSGSSPGSYKGFLLANGQTVRFNLEVKGYAVYPVIGICRNGTGAGVRVASDLEYTSTPPYQISVSGTTYTCDWYRVTDAQFGTADTWVEITGSGSERVLIAVSGEKAFESGQCGSGNGYWDVELKSLSVIPESMGSASYANVYGSSGVSCSGGGWTDAHSGTSASGSFSCSVSSSASGSKYVAVEWEDLGVEYFHAYNDAFSIFHSDDFVVDSAKKYFTVEHPATDVSLSSVAQTPDDTAVQGTVTVSGGTLFDDVKIYVDGSLKATVNRSSFSCGSSSCTYHFKYSMYGKSDGSHTVKAELYVNSSLKDSTQVSFQYYDLGVKDLSASMSSAQFQVKGGYYQARVYVDNTGCVAKDWTNIAPSSATGWTTKTLNYSWPSCAATSGTHTVYVQVKDRSGHVVSTHATVTVTFNYHLSNVQPANGTRYEVGVDQEWTLPSSFKVHTSVDYSTDAPSATLKLSVGGSQVKTWTVSGSGTEQYDIPAANFSCGAGRQIQWSMGSASASTSVDIYCIHGDILQPSSTITLPSQDGQTVSSGSYVTVEVSAESNPSGALLTPHVTLDGQQGQQTQGSNPQHYYYRFDASGWQCGSSHTIDYTIDTSLTPQVFSTSKTFTVQCSKQFVHIDSPSDGQTYNIYEPIQDYQMVLSITYASDDPGATLKFWVNGDYRDLVQYSGQCASTACYVLDYKDGLQLGSNEVRVELYDSSGNKVAQDDVTFDVAYWSFSFGEDWSATPAVVYVKDNGDPYHADYCQYDLNGETGMMNFNDQQIRWELPIDKDDVGKVLKVSCYYGSTDVFDGNYTIQGQSSEQQAYPVAGGGSFTVTKVSAFPIFPDTERSGVYIYSVAVQSGPSPSSVFKDVYVSNGNLCFVPKYGKHQIHYYKANFTAFPTDKSSLDQLLGEVTPGDLRKVQVFQDGSAYCLPLKGTALIEDVVNDKYHYWFVVLDTAQGTFSMNVAVVGAVAALLLLYMLYQKNLIGGV